MVSLSSFRMHISATDISSRTFLLSNMFPSVMHLICTLFDWHQNLISTRLGWSFRASWSSTCRCCHPAVSENISQTGVWQQLGAYDAFHPIRWVGTNDGDTHRTEATSQGLDSSETIVNDALNYDTTVYISCYKYRNIGRRKIVFSRD